MTISYTVVVYKDSWTPSRPWRADLIFADGKKLLGWQTGFRTRKALIQNVLAVAPDAKVELR